MNSNILQGALTFIQKGQGEKFKIKHRGNKSCTGNNRNNDTQKNFAVQTYKSFFETYW